MRIGIHGLDLVAIVVGVIGGGCAVVVKPGEPRELVSTGKGDLRKVAICYRRTGAIEAFAIATTINQLDNPAIPHTVLALRRVRLNLLKDDRVVLPLHILA